MAELRGSFGEADHRRSAACVTLIDHGTPKWIRVSGPMTTRVVAPLPFVSAGVGKHGSQAQLTTRLADCHAIGPEEREQSAHPVASQLSSVRQRIGEAGNAAGCVVGVSGLASQWTADLRNVSGRVARHGPCPRRAVRDRSDAALFVISEA